MRLFALLSLKKKQKIFLRLFWIIVTKFIHSFMPSLFTFDFFLSNYWQFSLQNCGLPFFAFWKLVRKYCLLYNSGQPWISFGQHNWGTSWSGEIDNCITFYVNHTAREARGQSSRWTRRWSTTRGQLKRWGLLFLYQIFFWYYKIVFRNQNV